MTGELAAKRWVDEAFQHPVAGPTTIAAGWHDLGSAEAGARREGADVLSARRRFIQR